MLVRIARAWFPPGALPCRLKRGWACAWGLGVLVMAGCGPLGGGGVPAERLASLSSLARWEDRRLAPGDSLDGMMTSSDAQVRRAAFRTAGRIGRLDILPELLQGLGDSRSSNRVEAAFALGLLDGLQDDPSAARQVREALQRVLQEGPSGPRLAALEALAHVPGAGPLLIEPALHGDLAQAVRAWDGLRDRAGDLSSGDLVAAVRAGLTRRQNEVIWRVLRCAEKVPDSTLVAQLAPFVLARSAQVRVHALRALSQNQGPRPVRAALAGDEQLAGFSPADRARIQVAVLRLLGRLGPALLRPPQEVATGDDAGRLVARLIAGCHSRNSQVKRTALEAVSAIADSLPPPPQAVRRESLLPVWRLRLVRAAGERLADPSEVVRAAAVAATCGLRGFRCGPTPQQELAACDVLRAALQDSSLLVQEAALAAIAEHATDLDALGLLLPLCRRQSPRIRAAACSGLGRLWERRRAVLAADSLSALPAVQDILAGALERATADSDFTVVVAATSALSRFRSPAAMRLLCDVFARARGEGAADIQLAVLDGVNSLFGATRGRGTVPGGLAQTDTTFAQNAPSLVALLERAFDAPDVRLRLKGREVAQTTGLLPPELIPSAASLRATLPAYQRSRLQPAVALPSRAVHIRCQTVRGEFVIALDGEHAPNTVVSLLALITRGFYEGLTFHRVVPDFVIQGGDPRGDGWGGPGYCLRSEWSRVPYRRGTVGIAHSGKDTGGSQFFVALSPQPHLNGRYTVCGHVIRGMDVLDRVEPGDRFRIVVEPE